MYEGLKEKPTFSCRDVDNVRNEHFKLRIVDLSKILHVFWLKLHIFWTDFDKFSKEKALQMIFFCLHEKSGRRNCCNKKYFMFLNIFIFFFNFLSMFCKVFFSVFPQSNDITERKATIKVILSCFPIQFRSIIWYCHASIKLLPRLIDKIFFLFNVKKNQNIDYVQRTS